MIVNDRKLGGRAIEESNEEREPFALTSHHERDPNKMIAIASVCISPAWELAKHDISLILPFLISGWLFLSVLRSGISGLVRATGCFPTWLIQMLLREMLSVIRHQSLDLGAKCDATKVSVCALSSHSVCGVGKHVKKRL